VKTAWGFTVALGVLLALAVAAGCGGSGGGDPQIALLLPESNESRYEAHDHPEFEAKVKEVCKECEIIYSNAHQSASKQHSQAEAALTQGADVLVLDPVDTTAIGSVVEKADEEGVPVVSYDRLILGAPIDYYVSFDNVKVGELQAETLSEKLRENGSPNGPIVMINGPSTDPNAEQLKQGATKVFEGGGVQVAKSYDTPGWSPDLAQEEMQQAIAALGKNGFAATYAVDDVTAGGAIAAIKVAGIEPVSKPTAGQDAEIEALHRIMTDEQFMTIYKAIKKEAPTAAELAVALVEGRKIPPRRITGRVDNELEDVPSILLNPVAVTTDNITITVVKDLFWKVTELCDGRFAKICREETVD
jgi:D-xylose transport system substrate-binding protein